MITFKTDYFNLKQIADSGQCFRMIPLQGNDAGYSLISCGRYLEISQQEDILSLSCPEEELAYWKEYFDLNTDYAAMIASIDKKDSYLAQAAAWGNGIRILRQEPWEMIITFIISQQKTIPAIRSLVEALCCRYGTPLNTSYAFPSPEQLNKASIEDLQVLKLGYRAKYIKKICQDACNGDLDLNHLKSLDYDCAMEYLQRFYGIGEKVANCVCLFSLHHIDAFPVDTWIRKILLREYAPHCRGIKKVPQSRVCETLVHKYFDRYKGYAGVMQQYMFYYERCILNGK